MPNSNTKLQQAIQTMQADKVGADEIEKIITAWGKVAFAKLYSEMLLAFSDEEMSELEKIEDKKQMQKEVERRFRQKTKKNPEVLSAEYLDDIASEFLKARETKFKTSSA